MMRHLVILGLASCSTVATAAAQQQEKTFTLEGELGLIFTTGNTKTSSFKGRLSSSHELPLWSNSYTLESLYKQDEVSDTGGTEQTVTSAQKFFASGQGNYKLTNPDNRLFVFGSYEDDRFSSFDFQGTLAAGWNSKLWDDQTSSLSYSLGPGYSFAETVDGTDASGVIVRGAGEFTWHLSPTATFKQLLSSEVGSDNTKSRSETSISAQINGSLALKFSVILNYNSDVEADAANLDTETAATVVYHFF